LSPLKRETIDLTNRVHVTGKGIAYPIDRLSRVGRGLLMERQFRDHPTVRYLQAWLLPHEGWRVCRYTPHEGVHWCDWYIDICQIEETDDRCLVTDLFLDVGVHEGKGYDLLDCDELGAALTAGLISARQAQGALDSLQYLCDLLVRYEYRMEPLLQALLDPSAEVAAAGMRQPRGKGAIGGTRGMSP
jgi:uncharacterized protein